MKVNIVARGPELTPQLDAHIRQRLDAAVEHHRDSIDWVVVALVSGGGPVRCSLDFGLTPRGRLRFEQIEPETLDAIHGALAQAGPAVAAFIDSLQEGGPVVVPRDPPRDV